MDAAGKVQSRWPFAEEEIVELATNLLMQDTH